MIKFTSWWNGLAIRRRFELGVAFGLAVVLVLSLLLTGQDSDEFDAGPLPDFASFDNVNEMKAAFFGYMTPIIQHQNAVVAQQRQQLQMLLAELEDGGSLGRKQMTQLEALAEYYEFELDGADLQRSVRRVLLRADEIPLELALVQAAKESGWGRSRFAVDANNLFGQWCYSVGCGVVPAQRPAGEIYEVQRFDSVNDAIAAYIRNLNTHDPYASFRLMRAGMRSADESLDAILLSEGLLHYSQRREAYVDELQSMIRQYRQFQVEQGLIQ